MPQNEYQSYFIINNQRQYQPRTLSTKEVELQRRQPSQDMKRLPVSSRCHRVMKDSTDSARNKQNVIQQGQVLRTYYVKQDLTHSNTNSIPFGQFQHYRANNHDTLEQSMLKYRLKSTSEQVNPKQSTMSFNIQQNLLNIHKSIMLFNNPLDKTVKNTPFEHLTQSVYTTQTMLGNPYNKNENRIEQHLEQKIDNIESRLSESSSQVTNNKRSKLRLFKDKLKIGIEMEESLGAQHVDENGQQRLLQNKLVARQLQQSIYEKDQNNIATIKQPTFTPSIVITQQLNNKHLPHEQVLTSAVKPLDQFDNETIEIKQSHFQQALQQPILSVSERIKRLKQNSKKHKNTNKSQSMILMVDPKDNLNQKLINSLVTHNQIKEITLSNNQAHYREIKLNNSHLDHGFIEPQIRQTDEISFQPMQKQRFITHLLSPQERQESMLLKGQQKVTNLNPKPCQSLIFQIVPEQVSSYSQLPQPPMETRDYFEQEKRRQQEAKEILNRLMDMKIIS